mmetsp:Transcript_1624/g.2594  ORF Transcript_1624/g.2594 Transcript_1624/m.2594 type:complete len:86 (+) Transcript_1624:28-285(+)
MQLSFKYSSRIISGPASMRLEHALAYNNDAVRASLHMIQLICWQTWHEDYSKDDGDNHYPSTLSPQAHLPQASCMHQPNPPAQTD